MLGELVALRSKALAWSLGHEIELGQLALGFPPVRRCACPFKVSRPDRVGDT